VEENGNISGRDCRNRKKPGGEAVESEKIEKPGALCLFAASA
jgi:hypothetical protein